MTCGALGPLRLAGGEGQSDDGVQGVMFAIPLSRASTLGTHTAGLTFAIAHTFWRAFAFLALTLDAVLSEPDGDSQILEAWLLRYIEFMSIDCDSLKSLLLSMLFVFWF